MSADTTATPEAATDNTPALSIKDAAAQYAKITALAGAYKDVETTVRAEVQAQLLRLHDETGTKSIVVKDASGDPLVTYSVVEPTATDTVKVENSEAFLDWVMAHYPTEVETVVQVRPSFQSLLLARIEKIGDDLYDKETGEQITDAGLTHVHTPAGAPTSITQTWARASKDKASGKERALAWVTADDGVELPAIEG